ncbi:SIMPL domain-containing protein [Bacillus sp. FJAT-22090]|uniref:SIMPL domain-containing protein n=1 Tax=Bacillus sp. FJAT-22090 TaxID=1581038 RepID=UPI0011A7F6FA|nr:SIMPL domain-containing protein [Bacillus sp. FJAT-22090]
MYFPNFNQLSSPRVITVTGNGEIAAQPSYVQFQVEVSTEGKDLSEVQQENANIMNQVIQSILAQGIPREDIQTAAYNIVPNYDYVEGKQLFRGYEVTNAITVKVREIDKVGTIIDHAVQNGANRISSVQFKLEDADPYYQQALRIALQNAQTKAKTIADKMKLPLQPQPIEIVEESNAAPILFKSVTMAEQSYSTPIEQGQITISAAVRVKFQY